MEVRLSLHRNDERLCGSPAVVDVTAVSQPPLDSERRRHSKRRCSSKVVGRVLSASGDPCWEQVLQGKLRPNLPTLQRGWPWVPPPLAHPPVPLAPLSPSPTREQCGRPVPLGPPISAVPAPLFLSQVFSGMTSFLDFSTDLGPDVLSSTPPASPAWFLCSRPAGGSRWPPGAPAGCTGRAAPGLDLAPGGRCLPRASSTPAHRLPPPSPLNSV